MPSTSGISALPLSTSVLYTSISVLISFVTPVLQACPALFGGQAGGLLIRGGGPLFPGVGGHPKGSPTEALLGELCHNKLYKGPEQKLLPAISKASALPLSTSLLYTSISVLISFVTPVLQACPALFGGAGRGFINPRGWAIIPWGGGPS